MIKAVIFDCFGVLYPQPVGNFFRAHKEYLKNGIDELHKLSLQVDLGEITRQDFFNGLETMTGISANEIRKEFDEQLHPDVQLVEAIEKMRSAHKIGLISNAGKEEIEILYRDKLDGLFDAITISYEAHSVKPDPEIYLLCVERLGVEPESCLFVDDTSANLAAAELLGMRTLLYPEFGNMPQKLQDLVPIDPQTTAPTAN
jgi:putative hydrolase of the HAD superfamily